MGANNEPVWARPRRRGQGAPTKAYSPYGEEAQRRDRRRGASRPACYFSPGHLVNRAELKEIIARVIERMAKDDAPRPACVFNDSPCDVSTEYAVGEEA